MIKKFLYNLLNIKENKIEIEEVSKIKEEIKPDFEYAIYLPENWHYEIIHARYTEIDINIYYKNTFVFSAVYGKYSKDIKNVYKRSYYESEELYNKIQEIVEYNTNEHKKVKLNQELEVLKIIEN